MKINVCIGGSYVEVDANLDLDKEDMKRKEWCETTLASFFRSTRCGIKRIEYYKTEKHGELIKVFYSDDGTYSKDCWITGDSLAAVVEDMFRQRAVY